MSAPGSETEGAEPPSAPRVARFEVAAPARRLAAFRIALGVFITVYLVVRLPVFLELGDRSASRFDPVGVFRIIDRPLLGATNDVIVVAVIALGVLFVLGRWFRVSGPLFALGILVLMSHRSSWGQMLHFENLMTLHVVVVGLAPSAEAWSLDVRRRTTGGEVEDPPPSARYGWPLRIAAVITVVTYAIAGVAKLRYGGLEWMAGDTLRNHIAYAATRLELFDEPSAPLATWVVGHPWALKPAAPLSVLVELVAPIALLGGRLRTAWVVAAWLMHLTIYLTMFIGFPSPLFLVGFAPLFALERGVDTIRARVSR